MGANKKEKSVQIEAVRDDVSGVGRAQTAVNTQAIPANHLEGELIDLQAAAK